MVFAQENRIALLVNRDEPGPVIAFKLVVRREVLRTLPAQQPPVRSLCAGAFRHRAILTKDGNIELASCGACRGR